MSCHSTGTHYRLLFETSHVNLVASMKCFKARMPSGSMSDIKWRHIFFRGGIKPFWLMGAGRIIFLQPAAIHTSIRPVPIVLIWKMESSQIIAEAVILCISMSQNDRSG